LGFCLLGVFVDDMMDYIREGNAHWPITGK